MKSLKLESQGVLKLREVSNPVPELGETVISVVLAGVGGSEYLGLENPGIRPLPNAMAHGIVGQKANGELVAVYPLHGCTTCLFCKNDQVQLCENWALIGVHSDGGFQEALAVPDAALVAVPEALSAEQAVFIEPFANSVNAWEIAKVQNHESVAVIGAGGLGLGLVACASQCAAFNINLVDWSEPRQQAARELGAQYVGDKLDGSYDVVFDTVGSEEAREMAISLTKKRGRCIFMGFETAVHPVNFNELIRHQKQFLGSFVYSKSQFQEAITLAAQCNKSWVKTVSFEQVESHLRDFQTGNFEVVKLALDPKRQA